MTRKLIVIILYILVIIVAGFVFLTPAKHDTAATTAVQSSEEGEQRLRDAIDSAVQQAENEMAENGVTISETAETGLTEQTEESDAASSDAKSEADIEKEAAIEKTTEPEIVESDDGRYSVTMLAESIQMTARIDANLREGPASSYTQVGAIRTNDKVEILGTVDTLDGVAISPIWNEIKTEDGTIAYVRSDLLTE